MKERTLGVYVGLAVDPATDWELVCSRAAEAGYTSISVFLTTAFYNTGLWPWPYVNGKFNYSAINPDYRANFKRACLAAKAHDLKLHLCIVDQFHWDGEAKGPDPFTALGSAEVLYSSYADGKKHWLWWSDDKDPRYLATPGATLAQYKVIGEFGNGMLRFLLMLANVLKNTGVKFSFKWGNETFGRADKKSQTRGDRDECVIWARSIFRRAGLEPDLYFDFLAFVGGVGRNHIDYPVMHDAFTKGIRRKHRAKLEVHGILSTADAAKFGFTPDEQAFIKWSTDGDLRMEGDYEGLGKSDLPDVDLKMDARVVKAKTVMDFFNGLMPKYAHYIKD